MSQTIQTGVFDADYLSDIIPYRCPKCGDSNRFSSLTDLKLHLEKIHAFELGGIKQRNRTQVFDFKTSEKSQRDAANEKNKKVTIKDNGRTSPLLQSFKDDKQFLEHQLETAKETEKWNKLRKYKDNRKLQESDTIASLNERILKSRNCQWKAEEALYNTDHILKNLQHSVEKRFEDQRGIISDLVSSLSIKEEQLLHASSVLENLQADRQRLMEETNSILRKNAIGNEKLRFELERRDDILDSVHMQLSDLRMKTQESMKLKDGELTATKNQLIKLEEEKNMLLKDLERLLQVSDGDSLVLKQALSDKERKLSIVNTELENLRREKNDLAEESVKLFQTAKDGTQKLKGVIQNKDDQLQKAELQLSQMKQLQEDLAQESQTLTSQAEEHNQNLRKLLIDKENMLSSIQKELQQVTMERNKLLNDTFDIRSPNYQQGLVQTALSDMEMQRPSAKNATIKEQIYNSDQTGSDSTEHKKTEQLQMLLEQKQSELIHKQMEFDSLKEYINTTTEREKIARKKLEDFISDLIERTDKAEKEVKYLRGQTTDNANAYPADIPERDSCDMVRKTAKILQPEYTSTPRNFDVRPKYQSHANNQPQAYSSVAKQVMQVAMDPQKESMTMDCSVNEISAIHPPDGLTEAEQPYKETNTTNSIHRPLKPTAKKRKSKPQSDKKLDKHCPVSSPQKTPDKKYNPGAVSYDEDSTEYSPLPHSLSRSSLVSQDRQNISDSSHGERKHERKKLVKPDSVVFDESICNSDKFSIDSYNKLPKDLPPNLKQDANIVYIPFHKVTGQPINFNMEDTERKEGIVGSLGGFAST